MKQSLFQRLLQGTSTTASAVVIHVILVRASLCLCVYYINGFHVNVDEQTLILDKYTNTPSYRVGLLVTESFTTPNDDTTLNDNA